jgi:hypothetical protein
MNGGHLDLGAVGHRIDLRVRPAEGRLRADVDAPAYQSETSPVIPT